LEGSPKILAAEKGALVVLDFGGKAAGLQVFGDYWNISGLKVTGSSAAGIRLAGNHNVVEDCEAFGNSNTGIQIGGLSTEPRGNWPQGNLVQSCLSHDNVDPAEEDSDGFAAKLCVGAGNAFRFCVSAHNCDDGWDLYTKRETGPIEPVLIEGCVAYGNGILSNGRATKGDGNGFKLGGEGLAVKNIARDCVAFSNSAEGFTCNSNPAAVIEGAVSCDNGAANFGFTLYKGAIPAFALSRLYSLRTVPGPRDDFSFALLGEDVFLYDGKETLNVKGAALDASIFKSLKAPASVPIGLDGRPVLLGYLEFKG
jgi:hypothetical protein